MSRARRWKDRLRRSMVWGAAGLVALLCAGLVLYLLVKGLPRLSFDFLASSPSALKGTVGVWPNLLNTLYILLLALVVALPLGIGAAVYLNEYAESPRLIRVIEFTVESLAGIPSILYGLVGMLLFSRVLGLKTSLLAGGLTLVVMILPVVIRTTQEALRTVPVAYREGALALGAGRWHVIRTVVLPASGGGILTGAILAAGRVIGESAALLFTAGVGSQVAGNLATAYAQSGGTLSVMLYVYVQERAQFDVGYAIAALLLLLALGVNFAARRVEKGLGNRMRKETEQAATKEKTV